MLIWGTAKQAQMILDLYAPLSNLSARFLIDANRILCTGFFNGGFDYAVGCYLSNLFAAIAHLYNDDGRALNQSGSNLSTSLSQCP